MLDFWLHKKFKKVIKLLEKIMGLAEDLQAKLDTLQTALDQEQAEVAAKLEALATEIANLKGQIVPDETASAILSRIDGIITDLQSTVTPDEPTP